MPEDPPERKGLLDEMDDLERKRKAKKEKASKKKDSDDALDLSRIG